MTDRRPRARILGCGLLLLLLGCGGGPAAAPEVAPRTAAPAPSTVAKRRAELPDDCEAVPGQPPPEPLRTRYTGVAKSARCQREVFTIMGGVTHFLGVECKHCHLEPDYAADTHNKRVANWMAAVLIPRIRQRSGADVGCRDCHRGEAKFLGNPRRAEFAIDWMLTHMVDDFATASGLPPKCKDCHGGDLGTPAFRPKLLLTELGELTPAASAPLSSPPPPALTNPASASSAAPVPDFGGR